MSDVSATVTPGKVWTPDVNGKILLDAASMNLAANPTIVVPLKNMVDVEDIKDDAVTSDAILDGSVGILKLKSGASAYLKKLSLTATDDADGTGKMAIQVQDCNGTSLADYFVVRVWISTSILGVPIAVTGFATLAGYGQTINTEEAKAMLLTMSNGSGQVTIDVNLGGAGTRYVMAEIGGLVVYKTLTLTS